MGIKISLKQVSVALLLFVSLGAVPVNAMDKALSDCMECHSIAPLSNDELTLDERMKRIGPSLYYAGNKYKKAWLEKWLQNPTRIHPAGVYYGKHVEVTDEGDIVREAELEIHPKLEQQDAKQVSDALMKLTAKTDLVADVSVSEIKKVSRRMGSMNFTKFKGCASCHQDGSGEGGLSGPELYTAFERLQLTYLVSYLKKPVAWEPYSLMPNQNLKQKDIEKLLGYLKTLSEDKP